jgi:hypothetical protein
MINSLLKYSFLKFGLGYMKVLLRKSRLKSKIVDVPIIKRGAFPVTG